MAVKYVLVERKNPLKPTDPKKTYAQAVSAGEVNLKQLSKDISARCTVNSSDTLAVLDALIQQLTKELEAGRIVRLGDFGAFQLSLSSAGIEGKETFTSSLIRKSRIVFRPGMDLKNMLAIVSYEKG